MRIENLSDAVIYSVYSLFTINLILTVVTVLQAFSADSLVLSVSVHSRRSIVAIRRSSAH